MKSVIDIINSNRCYACGMCCSVCPENAISTEPDTKSGFYKTVLNENACLSCGLCRTTCPAAEDVIPPRDTLGEHRRITLCHSTNSEVRKMATSGGAVNSVIRCVIENGIAENVVTVKENINSPFDSEIAVIDVSGIDTLTKSPRDFTSRYVSMPVLSAVKQTKGKTAVVGTPCQIKALAKYDRQNRFIKIAIACSGATSYNASKIIKERLADEDYHIFYRGNGWPGCNTLTNGENTVETTHGKSYFEKMFSSQIFKSRACRNCPSHFAEESDLTFFDFWNAEEMKSETLGNSVCVIRTQQGEDVFNAACEKGYLETVKEIDEEAAVKTQAVPLKYKSLRPYGGIYFKLIDIIVKLRLYKLIPLKAYRYFCRLLAKTVK